MNGGRLVFIGLGLYDEHGVTARGLDEIKAADVVFAESYTSMLSSGALEALEKRTGKTFTRLGRREVEEGAPILEHSIGKRTVLLVAGDPMTATTHVDLRLRAIKEHIETSVVHGVSALVAVPGLLGLQHYKFGRTISLPFPQEGYSPTSPYEGLAENISRGLHTLILLDIDAENSRYMTANEGMHLLQDMESRVRKGVIASDTLVCVVARAGSENPTVKAGRLAEMSRLDFGPQLHSLAVPGKLHFMEQEALELLAGLRQ